MRLPYWLNREQRIHDLKVLLKAARDEHLRAFRMYTAKCAEVQRLRAELDKHEGATPNA